MHDWNLRNFLSRKLLMPCLWSFASILPCLWPEAGRKKHLMRYFILTHSESRCSFSRHVSEMGCHSSDKLWAQDKIDNVRWQRKQGAGTKGRCGSTASYTSLGGFTPTLSLFHNLQSGTAIVKIYLKSLWSYFVCFSRTSLERKKRLQHIHIILILKMC